MLDVMRRHSQSFVIYLMFAVLIVVFAINFGPGSGGCEGNDGLYAAKVNGQLVNDQEYLRQYADVYRYWQNRSPEFFTSEQARKMNLKRQVLDQMINQRLLAQEAERRGLTVVESELRDAILANPMFQVNDQFDYTAYEAYVLRYRQMSIPRYEVQMRQELLAQKMIDLVGEGVTVSREELEAEYRTQRDRVQLHFARFDPMAYGKAVTVTDADVEAALKDRDADVRAFFDREQQRYKDERQVKVRRILVPLAKDASPDDLAAAQGELAALSAQLAGGADFAELAKKHSKGPEAASGGDVGWVGAKPEERGYLRATATLNAGQTTERPVRLPEGLALVKVEDVRPPRQYSFEEVKTRVARDLLQNQRGAADAVRAAEAMLTAVTGGAAPETLTSPAPADDMLATPAPLAKPYLETTPWVTRDMMAIPRIGIDPTLMADSFALDKGGAVLSKVYRVGRHFYVVWLAQRERPDMAAFDVELDELRDATVGRKRNYVLSKWIKLLRDGAAIEVNEGIVSYGAGPGGQPDNG